MSGKFLLDSSALALSLFNIILLAWLGLTVLFNAERRSWGVLLAAGGALAGVIFFLIHAYILSQGAAALLQGFLFWWHAGWLPLIAAPFAWYLLMLWYSGFWEPRPNALRRRQGAWVWIILAFTLLLAVVLLFADPLPVIDRGIYQQSSRLTMLGSVPLFLLAYPVYILVCVGLALDALVRPMPSGRVMGDQARQRARPWLIGASILMFLVSLLVGCFFIWLIQVGQQIPQVAALLNRYAQAISIFDLLLSALLTAAVLLLGQAAVSYEIFTGRTLPRRGLLRHWRYVLLFAGGLSLLAAVGLTLPLTPIIVVLGLLLLAAVSYAFFSWLSYKTRAQYVRQMRPFAASQRLFDNILNPAIDAPAADLDLTAPFEVLCREVLGASRAALVPLGALAALGIPPLRYPTGLRSELPLVYGLLDQFSTPQLAGLPLNPDTQSGFIWAAPLWSERGLTGILLLGEKSDGGVYGLEEIEIARASSERLADVLASAEIARRLVMLQRQRLVESGLLDRHTRRVLHDDVLPRLHTVMLQLGARQGQAGQADYQESEEILNLLAGAHRQISDLLRDLPRVTVPELSQAGLAGALQHMLRTEMPQDFDEVIWEIDPHAERRARELPSLAAEVFFFAAREAMRNAARHGRTLGDPRGLRLKVSMYWENGLTVSIEDNGKGMPPAGAYSGEGGQGLSLHSTMMAVINGSLQLESSPGEFTRVILHLPESALLMWATGSPV
ncbi:MAG: sensor histidine kinase [Anaerolineales bacterium]